jgi:hypothetical protein
VKRSALLFTAAALVFAAACTDPGAGIVYPYDPAPVPFVPDHTEPVPATGTPPDGRYWATIDSVDEQAATITFTFQQAFFDNAGGMRVVEQPSREIVASAANLKFASVAATTRQNFAVPATELIRLVLGMKPTGKAPTGTAPPQYSYVPYPMLVTVEGGVVTEAYQIWMADLP